MIPLYQIYHGAEYRRVSGCNGHMNICRWNWFTSFILPRQLHQVKWLCFRVQIPFTKWWMYLLKRIQCVKAIYISRNSAYWMTSAWLNIFLCAEQDLVFACICHFCNRCFLIAATYYRDHIKYVSINQHCEIIGNSQTLFCWRSIVDVWSCALWYRFHKTDYTSISGLFFLGPRNILSLHKVLTAWSQNGGNHIWAQNNRKQDLDISVRYVH